MEICSNLVDKSCHSTSLGRSMEEGWILSNSAYFKWSTGLLRHSHFIHDPLASWDIPNLFMIHHGLRRHSQSIHDPPWLPETLLPCRAVEVFSPSFHLLQDQLPATSHTDAGYIDDEADGMRAPPVTEQPKVDGPPSRVCTLICCRADYFVKLYPPFN
jgi:hypothetical protein